jgi:UDP-N-acetylmuramate--alanine ligase
MMTSTGNSQAPISLPAPPARVHFVGIGGIGMSGLARILHAWGYQVTGSDAAASDQTIRLASEGIPVTIGHHDASAAADLVVMTAAVREDNPEVLAARRAGVPVVKRAELLGLLANARRCIAVAGSHGKSTTSGMLVSAMNALGMEPSYAVGAVVASTGSNAAPGKGSFMVVEADEYDHSFLWLQSHLAIVTNIEYDHPDIFSSQEAYDAAFGRFIERIKPGGSLIFAADDRGCSRLLARPELAIPDCHVGFGENDSAAWRLTGEDGAWTLIAPSGESVPLQLSVPGRHNARNATAALAALAALGIGPADAAAALSTYTGIGRRFETIGERNGIVVIDDYAHHPTELRATLDAARRHFPGRRLWAVFQPHTYSRTKAFLGEFAAALESADEILVLDIYPSRETDTLGISSADLVRLMPGQATTGGNVGEALPRLQTEVRPGDVVLTIGAGDVTTLGPALLTAIATAGRAP